MLNISTHSYPPKINVSSTFEFRVAALNPTRRKAEHSVHLAVVASGHKCYHFQNQQIHAITKKQLIDLHIIPNKFQLSVFLSSRVKEIYLRREEECPGIAAERQNRRL